MLDLLKYMLHFKHKSLQQMMKFLKEILLPLMNSQKSGLLVLIGEF